MKTKWTKSVPKDEGWYWVRYGGKHGTVICPARVLNLSLADKPLMTITTARNDFFSSKNLKDLKFGPYIPFPDECKEKGGGT